MLNRDQAIAGTTTTTATGSITTLFNYHLHIDVAIAAAYAGLIVVFIGALIGFAKWLYDRNPANPPVPNTAPVSTTNNSINNADEPLKRVQHNGF